MPVSLLIATSAHHVGFGLVGSFIKGRGKQTRGRSWWFELFPGGSRDVCFTARSGLGRRPGEVGGAEDSVPALGAAGALSQPQDALSAPGPPLPPGSRRRGGKQRGGSSSAPHPTAYFFRSVLERGRWDSPPLLLLQYMGSKSFSATPPPPGPPPSGPPGPDPAAVRS